MLARGVRASELARRRTESASRLQLRDAGLERAVFGPHGLPRRGVFEIYGAAGVGKTQWCLEFLLSTRRKAMYITTEGRAPTSRLAEISRNDEDMDRILIREAAADEGVLLDVDGLWKNIPHDVEIVVLDSIAACFRGDTDLARRSEVLFNWASAVKKLNVLVVCVNQVSFSFTTQTLVPTMGDTFGHFIDYRLHLRRDAETSEKRTAELEVSSSHPSGVVIEYVICPHKGVVLA